MREYRSPEDLPNEVRKYCEQWSYGVWLMHPFRFERFPFCSDPDILTEIAEQEASFQGAIDKGEWEESFELVEGWRHRFCYLNSKIEPQMPRDLCGDRKYWSLVFCGLRGSTNHFGQTKNILKALDCSRSEKLSVLNGEDHEKFIDLDGTITGWRGVNAVCKLEAKEYILGGFSWTIDRGKAVWFAHRSIEADGNAYVARAEFKKHEIEAYFPSAGEGEFIVKPSSDRQVCVELLYRDTPVSP